MSASKGMEMKVGVQDGLNIEEEYIKTLRTQSNARFLSEKLEDGEEMKALLQLQQEIIPPMPLKRKTTEIELAMSDYFNASIEASEICRQILRNIRNTRSNCQSMDSFLASISGTSTTTSKQFPFGSNPFSSTTKSSFMVIHGKYSSILQTIKSSHKKVARKLKIAKTLKKLSRICLIMACGTVGAVGIAIVAHLLFFGLLIGPAVMGICPLALKRRITRLERSKTKSLWQLQKQLDTAAKGTYVLGREFDTVSHLVAQLSDGIEREHAMAKHCVEMMEEKFPVQEMVTALRRSCSDSRKLAEELEEHVCMCLATIHRARVLVMEQISKQP